MSITRRAFLATTASVGTSIGCSSLIANTSESVADGRQLHIDSASNGNIDQIFKAIDAWAKIEYSPRLANNWYSNIFIQARCNHVRSFIKDYYLKNNELPKGNINFGYTDENNIARKKVHVGSVNLYRLPGEIEAILSVTS